MSLTKFSFLLAFVFSILSSGLPASLYAAQTGCPDGEALLTEARPKALMTIVVVGGYSSGADIAPEARALGVGTIIHIHPASKIPAALEHSFNARDYNHDLVYRGKLSELIESLQKHGQIDAVYAGTETGVELADRINEALELKGNPTSLSHARRNKWEMHQRLKQLGLPSIRDLKSKDLNEILAWIDSPQGNEGAYPVVVKPIDGAGTQGVYICYDRKQVISAFKSLIGTKNVLDIPVNEVLVQEYLAGEEYVVNTVSRDGKHVVGEIWHYNKRKTPRPDGGFSNIYLFDELQAFNGPLAKELLPYAKQVLDALGFEQGPAHMEIMLTKRGPVLIEVGARLMGGHSYVAARAATGTSPLDLMIKSRVAPEEFERAAVDGAIQRKKFVRNVQLISKQSGTITKVNYTEEKMRELLPSFAGMSIAGVGEPLSPTVDLVTAPGSMWLISDSAAALERDYKLFRDKIEPGLFDVQP